MDRIHLILVDDQVLFVESLRRVLETIAEDFRVDAVAFDGHQAVEFVRRHRPQVVLMDVRMPGMDGVEATRRIVQEFPETHVIVLTTFDDDEYVHQALKNGAVGYLLKDIPPQELVSAVRAIRSGAFLISPPIAARLVEQASGKRRAAPADGRPEAMPEWIKTLGRREKEILYYISHGLSNREISHTLFLAEQTVKNQVSILYSKIGENDRYRVIEKIKECLERGYLQPP